MLEFVPDEVLHVLPHESLGLSWLTVNDPPGDLVVNERDVVPGRMGTLPRSVDAEIPKRANRLITGLPAMPITMAWNPSACCSSSVKSSRAVGGLSTIVIFDCSR